MAKRVIFSIILIGIGFISLGIGFFYIDYSINESNYEFSELRSNVRDIRELEFFSPYYKIDPVTNQIYVHYDRFILDKDTYIKYKIIFQSKDIFSVDNRIDYKIRATVIGKDLVDRVVFFIDERGVDYSKINKSNFDSIIDHLKGETVIELEKLPSVEENMEILDEEDILDKENGVIHLPSGLTYYEDLGFFTSPIEQNITLHPFVLGKDDVLYRFETAKNLLSISPATAKLQAETNKIQFELTKNQAIANDIILGLTFVIVSGIPFGIATQILVMYEKNIKSQTNIMQNLTQIEKVVKKIKNIIDYVKTNE